MRNARQRICPVFGAKIVEGQRLDNMISEAKSTAFTPCMEEQCAWWAEGIEGCAVKFIMFTLALYKKDDQGQSKPAKEQH